MSTAKAGTFRNIHTCTIHWVIYFNSTSANPSAQLEFQTTSLSICFSLIKVGSYIKVLLFQFPLSTICQAICWHSSFPATKTFYNLDPDVSKLIQKHFGLLLILLKTCFVIKNDDLRTVIIWLKTWRNGALYTSVYDSD